MKEILRGTLSGVAATVVTLGAYIPLQTTIGISLVLGAVTFLGSYIIIPKEKGIDEITSEIEALASREGLSKRLREAFEKYKSEEGLRQLQDLEKTVPMFLSLIQENFSEKGRTLGHFSQSVEQLRNHTLDRMVAIISFHRTMESIDVSLLKKKKESLPQGSAQELSIQERLGHYDRAQDKISYLHGDIEKSLTAISALSLEVAHIDIGEDKEIKFETFLEQVRRIAKDAAQFKKEI
jgi:hypothetical protein